MAKKTEYILGYSLNSRKIVSWKSLELAEQECAVYRVITAENYQEAKLMFEEATELEKEDNYE